MQTESKMKEEKGDEKRDEEATESKMITRY